MLAGFWLRLINLDQAVQTRAPSKRSWLLCLDDALRAFPSAGHLSAEEGSGWMTLVWQGHRLLSGLLDGHTVSSCHGCSK